MEKRNDTVKKMTVTALGIASVCIATRVLQFPIPLGYAHLGNTIILLFSIYFDPVSAGLAAGLGSALADLLSFPEWAVPTLIIKFIMGYVCSAIAHGTLKSDISFIQVKLKSVRTLAAVLAAIAIMVVGYTMAGSLLYGSLATGLLQVPGLVTEGIVGMVIFYCLAGAVSRVGREAGVFSL